jgi:hypothetical protein
MAGVKPSPIITDIRPASGYIGKPKREGIRNSLAFVITLLIAAMLCAAAWYGVMAIAAPSLREISKILS